MAWKIYCEIPHALELFPNGHGDKDEVLPLSAQTIRHPNGFSGSSAAVAADRLGSPSPPVG